VHRLVNEIRPGVVIGQRGADLVEPLGVQVGERANHLEMELSAVARELSELRIEVVGPLPQDAQQAERHFAACDRRQPELQPA
jgi:hypothetical protein